MAKILIVDNSRVPLRAVLEGAFADCEVVVARSAEEGLLELDLFSSLFCRYRH